MELVCPTPFAVSSSDSDAVLCPSSRRCKEKRRDDGLIELMVPFRSALEMKYRALVSVSIVVKDKRLRISISNGISPSESSVLHLRYAEGEDGDMKEGMGVSHTHRLQQSSLFNKKTRTNMTHQLDRT